MKIIINNKELKTEINIDVFKLEIENGDQFIIEEVIGYKDTFKIIAKNDHLMIEPGNGENAIEITSYSD